MNYPLRTRHLARNYAAVRCKVMFRPLRYIIDSDNPNYPAVFSMAAGEEIVELDPEVKVYTQEGEEVRPEGKFFRSTGTINPYHAILDIWDFNVLM